MPDSYDFSQPRAEQKSSDGKPLLTYLLCGICIVVMLAYYFSGDTPGTLFHNIGYLGRGSGIDIWEGSYYYLVTSFFSHGDYMHLIFNMIWLVQLGTILELTLKPWQYALFMLSATVISSCAELGFSGQTGIGASGVVYAMFGLLWMGRGKMAAWRTVATRNNLNIFVVWGVLCIFLTYIHVLNIANAAHGAGFLYGLCIGGLFFAPRRQPLLAIPLVGLTVFCALAVFWAPWLPLWDFLQGGKELDRHRYQQAIPWFQRSISNGVDSAKAASAWNNIGFAWHHLAMEAQEHHDTAGVDQASAQAKLALERAVEMETRATSEQKNEQKSETPARSGDFRPVLSKPGSK